MLNIGKISGVQIFFPIVCIWKLKDLLFDGNCNVKYTYLDKNLKGVDVCRHIFLYFISLHMAFLDGVQKLLTQLRNRENL